VMHNARCGSTFDSERRLKYRRFIPKTRHKTFSSR